MASNGDWGSLVEHDPDAADLWDSYARLPEPGSNPALDVFCERKNISIEGLLRVGAKLSDSHVLAFAFPGGLKYREITGKRRWSRLESKFARLKIIPAGAERTKHVIVCEGETDAARLTMAYDADVAVMPTGAKRFTPEFAEQLRPYEIVLVGLDNDEAGEAGSTKIIEALPNSQRFAPPANDWCDTSDNELPPLPAELDRLVIPPLVAAGELLRLEVPEHPSWFEHALLPIGGQLVIHGWIKSFKSFMALDLMSALAQGQDWACFEPTEEACRVAVVQFEIPWPFYRDRVTYLRGKAQEPELFDQNFLTYQPITRPYIKAGIKEHEDALLRELVNAEVQVVLLDPIRRMMRGGDMNTEQDGGKVLALFDRLNREGITVVTVHHDNKESAKSRGGDPLGMTGTGAFSGDADTLVSIELPRGDSYKSSTRRNLCFTLRNAAPVADRGAEMQEDSTILYCTEPFNKEDDDEDPDAPAI